MKNAKIPFLIIFFVMLAGCTSTKRFVKNPSKLKKIQRIAVLPFVCNKTEYGYNIAEILSANLVMSRFQVIERSQLEKILKEKDLSIRGIVEGRQSFVGKISGVDAFVMGSATMSRGWGGLAFGGNIDYVSNSTARLVDVFTGEVLGAAIFTSSAPNTWSGITTAAEVAEKLANELSKY